MTTTTTKFDCRPTESLDSRTVACYIFVVASDQRGNMRFTLILMQTLLCSLLGFLTSFPCGATVVTFDDLPSTATGLFITNGYQGLSWSNFGYGDAILHSNLNGVSGYNYGMVSPSNVAFNASGFPAEIDSFTTNFNFLSAYLTGAWNSNLNIEVEGFSGATLLYSNTVVASATNATLFTFNYMDIDRLYFNSSGGEPAGFASGAGEEFAMDNMTFDFIPEPSSLLLTALGAAGLCFYVRRRRA